MWKIYFMAILLLGGCSNFRINAAMCEQIVSDPHATIPQECRDYNEKEAQKAFDKTDIKQKPEDIIEFNKEEK